MHRTRVPKEVRRTLSACGRYLRRWRHTHPFAPVARIDGQAVGSFSLLVFSSPIHGGKSHAVLDAVVINSDRRGEGIGQAMAAHANTLAMTDGCYKISLSSHMKRVVAHHVYEALGFQQHGVSVSLLFQTLEGGEPALHCAHYRCCGDNRFNGMR
jgi:GNAT superfamily N-acetyltransferase